MFPEWTTTTTFGDVDPSHRQEVYHDGLVGVTQDVLDAAMDYDQHKRPLGMPDEQPDSKRMRGEDTLSPSSNEIPSPVTVATAKKVHNEQWDAMFERLRGYKARHGNCLVPKRFSEDPKLGTWVETQVSFGLESVGQYFLSSCIIHSIVFISY